MMLRTGAGRPRPALDEAAYLGDADQLRSIGTIFGGSLCALNELYRPVEAQLARVDVPVLVGWGDSDPFFPVAQGERTAAALGTTLRIYPGAGHFLPEERPDDVASDIARLVALTSARTDEAPLERPSLVRADGYTAAGCAIRSSRAKTRNGDARRLLIENSTRRRIMMAHKAAGSSSGGDVR